MHYQVHQGLDGCFMPDTVMCFHEQYQAIAYLESEAETIAEMEWPIKWHGNLCFTYGPNLQFVASVEYSESCDDYCEDLDD